jgi:release factor glutamine methyltransferase
MNWTLLSLLRKAEGYLRENRVPSPRLEAEILLAHALSFDRVKLYTNFSRPMAGEEIDRFRALVQRRVKGEPTAYLTGRKEFFSLPFLVSPGVLIPRPETEEVVQAALDRIPGDGADEEILDLCTGSGCIAVTLLKLRPALRAVAIDRSPRAVELAKENARLNGVDGRLALHCGDLLEPLAEAAPRAPAQLITCNPPYIDPEGSCPADADVAAFEPKEALFTPPGEPLHFYEKVLAGAAPFLAPEGVLVFELGMGMRDPVASLAAGLGWRFAGVRRDLAGIERVLLLTATG